MRMMHETYESFFSCDITCNSRILLLRSLLMCIRCIVSNCITCTTMCHFRTIEYYPFKPVSVNEEHSNLPLGVQA